MRSHNNVMVSETKFGGLNSSSGEAVFIQEK